MSVPRWAATFFSRASSEALNGAGVAKFRAIDRSRQGMEKARCAGWVPHSDFKFRFADQPALKRVIDRPAQLFVCNGLRAGNIEQRAERRRQKETLTLLGVSAA